MDTQGSQKSRTSKAKQSEGAINHNMRFSKISVILQKVNNHKGARNLQERKKNQKEGEQITNSHI